MPAHYTSLPYFVTAAQAKTTPKWEDIADILGHVRDAEQKKLLAYYKNASQGSLPALIERRMILVQLGLAELGADASALEAGLVASAGTLGTKLFEDTSVSDLTAVIQSLPQLGPDTTFSDEAMRAWLHAGAIDPRILIVLIVVCAVQRAIGTDSNMRTTFIKQLARQLCLHDIAVFFLEPTNIVTQAESRKQGLEYIALEEAASNLLEDMKRNVSLSSVELRLTEAKWLSSHESPLSIEVVCNSVEECYQLLAELHRHWRSQPGALEDTISLAQVNGYRGLQTALQLPIGTAIPCAIHTQEMSEFAHRGLASLCFSDSAYATRSYAPWLDTLETITADTSVPDHQCIAYVHDDLLATHYTLYDMDGKPVHVPATATVLDAMCYMYGERALWLDNVADEGRVVPFSKPVAAGQQLSATFTTYRSMQRRWLQQSSTYVCHSLIAAAFNSTEQQRIAIGRQALQSILNEHAKGYLDEFEQQPWLPALKSLGYQSLDEACSAIASGHEDAYDVYTAIFMETGHDGKPESEAQYLSCEVPSTSSAKLRDVLEVYKQYPDVLSKLSIKRRWWRPKAAKHLRMKIQANQEERDRVIEELTLIGAKNIFIEQGYSQLMYLGFTFTLIALWGLDPIIASQLVTHYLPPIDLAIIRLFSLAAVASVVYYIQKKHSRQVLKPLSPRHPLLLSAGMLLTAVALGTYVTLSFVNPIIYILCIGITELIASLLQDERTGPIKNIRYAMLFVLVTVVTVLFTETESKLCAVIITVITAITFTLYSFAGSRYQRSTIQARYPAYLFWLSVIACIPALLLLPLATVWALPLSTIGLAILFATVFCIVPYFLFFECLKANRQSLRSVLLLLIVVVTTIGEWALLHHVLPLSVYSLIMLYGGLLLLTSVLTRKSKVANTVYGPNPVQ